jgi:hypothetical protein
VCLIFTVQLFYWNSSDPLPVVCCQDIYSEESNTEQLANWNGNTHFMHFPVNAAFSLRQNKTLTTTGYTLKHISCTPRQPAHRRTHQQSSDHQHPTTRDHRTAWSCTLRHRQALPVSQRPTRSLTANCQETACYARIVLETSPSNGGNAEFSIGDRSRILVIKRKSRFLPR